jgi:hypothetical protein
MRKRVRLRNPHARFLIRWMFELFDSDIAFVMSDAAAFTTP